MLYLNKSSDYFPKGRTIMNKNTKYKNEFIQNNYDRINLTVPKGVKEKMKSKADSLGLSVNSYILSLVARDIPGISTERTEEKRNIDVFLL